MDHDFRTEDDLIAYLVRTGGCEEEDARLLVSGLMAWRGDFGDRTMTPETCWNKISEFGFLYPEAKSGWITPEGRMHSAVYGAHERLLTWMGLEAAEVEKGGWARVGIHGWRCQYRLTRQQRDRIELCGHLVDAAAERLKPRRPTKDSLVTTPRLGP
ncbi:hypothetical protein ACVIGB_000431 [Bradyrhizobium sp. USDA 4341]